MEETIGLELSFRGGRSYLHGTDLYEALHEVLGKRFPCTDGGITLEFHGLLRSQPDLLLVQGDGREKRALPGYRASVRLGGNASGVEGVLLESGRPIADRRECNESAVRQAASVDLDARTIRLGVEEGTGASAIEKVVFLNKELLLRVIPESPGQWLFAKLKLNRWLLEGGQGEVGVELRQALANRFAVSAIRLNGEVVGEIVFSKSA